MDYIFYIGLFLTKCSFGHSVWRESVSDCGMEYFCLWPPVIPQHFSSFAFVMIVAYLESVFHCHLYLKIIWMNLVLISDLMWESSEKTNGFHIVAFKTHAHNSLHPGSLFYTQYHFCLVQCCKKATCQFCSCSRYTKKNTC